MVDKYKKEDEVARIIRRSDDDNTVRWVCMTCEHKYFPSFELLLNHLHTEHQYTMILMSIEDWNEAKLFEATNEG